MAVDLRGHAGSDQPHTAYTVELMADDVAELLQRLGVSRFAVVGHSLGGMVAYRMAATHLENVTSLVIINSFSRIPKVSAKAIAKLLQRTFIVYALGLDAWGRVLAKQLLPRDDQASMRAELAQLGKTNDHRGAYMGALKAAVKADLRNDLPRITCPVLILAADNDYTPTEDKRQDAALINSGRNQSSATGARVVEIPDSRHLSPWDQADRVNRELVTFLSGRDVQP